MEGAYNKVLSAKSSVPDQSYLYFMDKLISTVRYAERFCCTFPLGLPVAAYQMGCQEASCALVYLLISTSLPSCELLVYATKYVQVCSCCIACRDEGASCSERAYKQLSVTEAQKLMLFSSAKEALQFAQEVCLWHLLCISAVPIAVASLTKL